jgi:hypothetical protein
VANDTIYQTWLSLLKSNYCFICTWYYSNTLRFTGKRYFIFIGFVILVYIYLREITTDGINYNVLYNERNDQLLLRQAARLCCINLDGHVIYRYDIPGFLGLAVDQQGHVCISDYYSDDIHRLSPDGTFRDIVLSKHDGVDEPRGITVVFIYTVPI